MKRTPVRFHLRRFVNLAPATAVCETESNLNLCFKAENQKKAPESEALDPVIRSDVLFRVFGAHML